MSHGDMVRRTADRHISGSAEINVLDDQVAGIVKNRPFSGYDRSLRGTSPPDKYGLCCRSISIHSVVAGRRVVIGSAQFNDRTRRQIVRYGTPGLAGPTVRV